ncbi:MAG: tetratricopeptide repeat protein [Acidimicrobiales bacterium]|nr:tetratricopeptide repeat protein [Acidimicrobiales bacterium]
MPSPDLDGLLAELERAPDDARLHYLVACAYDGQGLEHEAVPHYVKAIATGLDGDELRNAHLGLGSTYRAIGRYEEALDTFDRGLETFPGAPELLVFRAMTLHNLGRPRRRCPSSSRCSSSTRTPSRSCDTAAPWSSTPTVSQKPGDLRVGHCPLPHGEPFPLR